MSEWKPISTAPRDGTFFVTANWNDPYLEDGEFEIARYAPQYYPRYEEVDGGLFKKVERLSSEFTSDNYHRATHWMELPEPPK